MKCTSGKFGEWQYKDQLMYVKSGVLYVLRNGFLLHHHTASSFSGCLWSSIRNHLLECCRVVLLWPSEWPEYWHGEGRSNARFSSGNKKKEITKWLIWRTWRMRLTQVLWRIMPYAASHCRVGGTTSLASTTRGRRCQMLPSKCCSTPFVNIVVYSLKQNWQDIRGLSVIHSVSELSGHELRNTNESAQNWLIVPGTVRWTIRHMDDMFWKWNISGRISNK